MKKEKRKLRQGNKGDLTESTVKKGVFRTALRLFGAVFTTMLLIILYGQITVTAADLFGGMKDADAEIKAAMCSHEQKPGSYVITEKETCTKNGLGKYTCVYCGEKIIETRNATGHSWGRWKTVTEAKCKTAGEKSRTCSSCRETETKTISALGHDISSSFMTRTPATCTSEGLEGKQCTRSGCGYWSKKSVNNRTIPKLNHSWGEWKTVTAATCETTGEKTRTCSSCKGTETETISELGHDISPDFTVIVSATCETEGKEGKKCRRAGCDYWSVKKVNNKVIPPLGHDYQLLKKISDATCTEPGKNLFRCSHPGCEHPEVTMETDKLEHKRSYPQGYESMGNGLHIFYFTCTECKGKVYDLSEIEYCSYYGKNYGEHTVWGHLIYKQCSCGQWDTFGYETDPSCLSCTTPPDIRITGIEPGAILNRSGFEAALPLRVLVQDNEEDNLSVYWLLDGERIAGEPTTGKASKNGTEMVLNGTPDLSSLSEGKHTLRVVADDPVAPDGSAEITFIYDNNAPMLYRDTEIIHGQGSISVSCYVCDALSGDVFFRLKAVKKESCSETGINEYFSGVPFLPAAKISTEEGENRFFVSSVFDEPDRGCDYILLISLMDSAGNETVCKENIPASYENPEILIRTCSDNRAEIIISDGISESSKFIITAVSETDSFTVSGNGRLTGFTKETDISEHAILLYGDSSGRKTVTAYGFAYGTVYTVMAGRINTDGSISWSDSKNIICDRNPHVINSLEAPEQVSTISGENFVTVYWSEVPGATVYDIEIDGMLYSAGQELRYVHRGLEPGSVHEYRVRGRNSVVKGSLSGYVSAEVKLPEEIPDAPGEQGDESGEQGNDSEEHGDGSGEQHPDTPVPAEPYITVNSAGKTYVSISWTASENGAAYEVFLDGTSVYTGKSCRYTFTGLVPGSSHAVSVSAHISTASASSSAVISTLAEENTNIITDRKPAVISAEPFAAVAGKTYRVLVPLYGIKADSRYSLEILFREGEVSIEDLFEPTKERELYDCAPEGTGRSLTVRHENGKLIVAVTWETTEGSEEGIMADFLVRAEVTGIIGFEYR